MTAPTGLERRIKAANMVPPEVAKPAAAWSAAAILEAVEAGVADTAAPAPRPVRSVFPLTKWRRTGPLVALAVALLILLPAAAMLLMNRSPSHSDVATSLPQDDVGAVEYYARFPGGQILHNADWAVIVFYRPPICIPPLVNLLDQRAPAAIDCGPQTVAGVATGQNGSANGAEIVFTGLGDVPVWIAPWPLVERLAADGVISRRDLLSMQTRIEATASTYRERSGTNLLEVEAVGQLADGRPFSFLLESDGASSELSSLSLPFSLGPVTESDLHGIWENGVGRVELRPDGSHTLTLIGLRGFGPQPAPPQGSMASEGTHVVESGFVTFVEDDPVFCPHRGTERMYFAQIGEDGRLTLDEVLDECSDGSWPGPPLSRVQQAP